MAAKVLHIEIGDRITKVCRPYKKGKTFKLADDFVFITPETFVSDGAIMEPEAMGQVLREQLTAHGLDNVRNAVFTLSSGKIATREVRLPPVKEKQLAAIIATNASEYFPVDLKDYHVTYCPLGTVNDAPDPYTRVLVMAAPLKLLDGYIKTAEAAELNLQAIDTAGNAHYQLIRQINPKDSSTIYVNVDCSHSDVTFLQGDTLMLQRTFSFGGDDMICHYLSSAGKLMDEYLHAIQELDVRAPAFAATSAIHTTDVESDLNRLIGSVARSVDYFNSNKYGELPTRIVLMGPCRHLTGLCELVAENTSIETVYLDDEPAFTKLTGDVPEAASYVSCLGSLVRPMDMMPDSLLPKSKAKRKDDDNIKSGLIIGGVLVAAAVALSAWALVNYFGAQNQLSTINAQIDQLAYTEVVHDTYLAYVQGQKDLEVLAAESSLPNSQLVAFCEELEKKMPSSILVLSADCTNEGVSMSITVGSYEDAATVISNLRTFESLSTVDVASVTRTTNEGGFTEVAFSLTCAYGENPYLNDVNPYAGTISEAEGDAAATEDTSASADYHAEEDAQLDAAAGEG